MTKRVDCSEKVWCVRFVLLRGHWKQVTCYKTPLNYNYVCVCVWYTYTHTLCASRTHTHCGFRLRGSVTLSWTLRKSLTQSCMSSEMCIDDHFFTCKSCLNDSSLLSCNESLQVTSELTRVYNTFVQTLVFQHLFIFIQ